MIFILQQDKTVKKYLEIFDFLKNKNIINLEIIITDFEKALINSLVYFGPETNNYGCLFHYNQCIW